MKIKTAVIAYIIITLMVLLYGCFAFAVQNRTNQTQNPYINDTLQSIMKGVSFGPNQANWPAGNLDAVVIEYTFNNAGTEYIIPHNLGRKPVGYLVTWQNGHGVYYVQDATKWTAGQISLSCNTAAVTMKLILF